MSCNSKQGYIDKITTAEAAFYSEENKFSVNKEAAQNAINAYVSYADKFKSDEASAGYLFKAADVSRALQDHDKSLEIWKRVYTNYPDFEKTPHSLFLSGFCYENDKGDIETARTLYQEFLNKYPSHDLRDDVQFSIDHLGMSPEDIIKEFDKKKEENSDPS